MYHKMSKRVKESDAAILFVFTRSCDEIAVRLSVRLSNACIVTKRKKAMFRFLYHTKEHLS